ncbi:MAG: DinB family protein [Gemmatimonadaceae bacterium]
MTIAGPLLMELEQEAQATRRILERVPDDKLAWRPHPKSSTLGQLAFHIASTPGAIAQLSQQDLDRVPDFSQPQPESRAQILTALEDSLATAKTVVGGMTDASFMSNWTMKNGGRVAMQLPKAALLRAIMLNHWYHHRGQLCVYLRMLDIPVPAIYGVSADENPLA